MGRNYDRYHELLELKRQRLLEEDEEIELHELKGTLEALEIERDYLNGECSIGGRYYEQGR